MTVTGKDLIEIGYRYGRWFGPALEHVNRAALEGEVLTDQRIQQGLHTHLEIQGDGNRFAFVGVSKQAGTTCLVTHHGSCGPGAGRNYLRSAHKRAQAGRGDADVFAGETTHIDARFYLGSIDISELPSVYKPAATVRAQMEQFDLAEVVDEIMPFGCVMSDDWERDAPWRKKKAKNG